MMMFSQSAMAEYVKLTALSGTGGTGGEGYAKLVDTYDGKNGRSHTKWGQSFDINNPDRYPAWVIVKADAAFTPQNYFLVTGNDTNGDQKRQWRSWNIYGANFNSDADAVKDAEAWVLIDQREDADVSMQNYGVTQFTLNDGESLVQYDGTPYQYYMIVVTRSHEDVDVYLQMAEFGFGTYADFQTWLDIQAADPTKPVTYRALAGSPAGFNNEGFANLINGNTSDKWCCGFTDREEGETANGGYIVFKASRPLAPTYYSLITGNDTGPSGDRNWKQWRIYGMNASSDAAVTRDAAGWVLLDRKQNIGHDQLPNANYALAYFTPSEENTTPYKYYKIEIDKVWSSGLMQMSEFGLGDDATLAIEKKAVIEGLAFDPDVFAEKAVLDQMAALIEEINACTSPVELGKLNTQANNLKTDIETSVKQYAELVTARGQAKIQLDDKNVAEGVVPYAQAWISETEVIAPCDDYPVGNFAYIKANRHLTGEEAVAEARRFMTYIMNNLKTVDEPIGEVGYQFICGTTDNWQAHESPAELIDGDRDGTKWGTGTSGDRWLVFKANEPIKPTYYGLVTGGDTHVYTDRNWRNWKIWAANFDEELDPDADGFNASAVKNSDKWVLIDEKNNVGTDVLKTTSLFESYINLSIGCAIPYSYFKIEVYHVGGMQMNEFTFYNQGDLKQYREGFVEEFADYDPEEEPAYKGYTDEFKSKYEELKSAVNAPDVMKVRNELAALQDTINVSCEKYALYAELVNELQAEGSNLNSLSTWFEGYTTDNVAPNKMFRRGTYEYIMENLSLDNSAMGNIQYLYQSSDSHDDEKSEWVKKYKYEPAYGELGYVQNMIDAARDNRYIMIEGNTDDQWGDGFHGNLIDAYFLNDTIKTDTTVVSGDNSKTYQLQKIILGTKWGGNAKGNDNEFINTYLIFRTPEPTNPFFYTLTTGDDTAVNTSRNWSTWYIYGANFECDGDATKDAEGWELIDVKENIGQDRLHPVNCQPSYFGFSSETETEYTYYMVVISKAFKGYQIQMNDLHFGTPEEFEAIQQEYISKANQFDYDIVAEQSLIDQYEQAIADIDQCKNMEVLFRVNYTIEELQKQITASAKAYNTFEEAVDAAKTYLDENPLAESDALALFKSYLNEDVEPGEDFPNGSAEYILSEHVLADSVLLDEIDFIESLKLAAVSAGYGKGVDISSMIVNPTFAKAGETLKDDEGTDLGREAEGWDGYIFRTNNANGSDVYAVEFCNYLAKFDVSQTLTDMKNGYYKVTLNAAYRGNGDEKLSSYAYAPMAYANDVQTFIPAIREDCIVDKEESWTGYAADHVVYYFDEVGDSIFVGYGMWGCEGAANAFSKGRYAITLVTQVSDGTLTFGVKNEYGTKGNEWTAVGNFGLWYLGESEEDAAAAIKEAADYNASRIETLTTLYVPDIDADPYDDAPGFAATQKATLLENQNVATLEAAKTIGETMEAIAETKQAYASLFNATEKIYDKWINVIPDDANQMEKEVDGARESLSEGTYENAAAAAAVEEALYAAYPDYLVVEAYNDNTFVTPSDEESFKYNIESLGRNPSVKIGGGDSGYGFYDALTEDEVIFAFDYSSTAELPASRFYIGKDADDTQAMDIAMPAAEELTPVYIYLKEAVSKWGFGKTTDEIRWRIAVGESDVVVDIRHARMITIAQMKAEGGKVINPAKGDANADFTVDIADAVAVLNAMAGKTVVGNPDVNGDGTVDIADAVAVLNIMAGKTN